MKSICNSCGEVYEKGNGGCPNCEALGSGGYLGESLGESLGSGGYSDSYSGKSSRVEDERDLINSFRREMAEDLSCYDTDETDESMDTARSFRRRAYRDDRSYKQTNIMIPTLLSIIAALLVMCLAVMVTMHFNNKREAVIDKLEAKSNSLNKEEYYEGEYLEEDLEEYSSSLQAEDKYADAKAEIEKAKDSAVFNLIEDVYGLDVGTAVDDFTQSLENIQSGSGDNLVSERMKLEYMENCSFESSFDSITDPARDLKSKTIKCILKTTGNSNATGGVTAIFIDEYDILISEVLPDKEKKVILETKEVNDFFTAYNVVYGEITDVIDTKTGYTVHIHAKYIENITEEEIIDNYYIEY